MKSVTIGVCAKSIRRILTVTMLAYLYLAQQTQAAQKGALVKTFAFGAAQFELDPTHHRLYATVPSTNSVAIIDTQSLTLLNTVFVGSNPFGLGLSDDGARLYVGNRGSTVNSIAVLDTGTMIIVNNFGLPVTPVDIAVGKDNIVYASPSGAATSHGIMVTNGLTGQSYNEIAPRHTYTGGLLEISPDRLSLFEQELGSSPSDVFKFNLTGTAGSLAFNMETGSNGEDLAVSHNGQFFAAPNGAPYNIKLFRTSDGAVLGTLNVGPYPQEVAFSPDDLYAYADHTSGIIDVYRTDTFLSAGPISISGESSELIVDETGAYLFTTVGSETRVYATGVPEPPSWILGSLSMMTLVVAFRFKRLAEF